MPGVPNASRKRMESRTVVEVGKAGMALIASVGRVRPQHSPTIDIRSDSIFKRPRRFRWVSRGLVVRDARRCRALHHEGLPDLILRSLPKGPRKARPDDKLR